MIVAHYVCPDCEVEGSDPEPAPNTAFCWNCGHSADITCRIADP